MEAKMRKSTIARKKTTRAEKKSTEDDLGKKEGNKIETEKRQREQANRRNRRKMAKCLSSILKELENETLKEEPVSDGVEKVANKTHNEDAQFKTERMQELSKLTPALPQRHVSHASAGADAMRKKILKEENVACSDAVEKFKRCLLSDVDTLKLPHDREGKLARIISMKPPPQKQIYFPM